MLSCGKQPTRVLKIHRDRRDDLVRCGVRGSFTICDPLTVGSRFLRWQTIVRDEKTRVETVKQRL